MSICTAVMAPSTQSSSLVQTALAVEEFTGVHALRVNSSAREDVRAGPTALAGLGDTTAWRDGWLVAAVRKDPPDLEALDTLVTRHWSRLLGRCRFLTHDGESASDLAQETWCRVLRARRSLKPDGNFQAYLATVATNLWRDGLRAERRAGSLGRKRVMSLDACPDGDVPSGTVTDPCTLEGGEHRLRAMNIDVALDRLPPLLRDVLVSRFLLGESSKEIGRRYERTEQTIRAWVRRALGELRLYFAGVDVLLEQNWNEGGRARVCALPGAPTRDRRRPARSKGCEI